MNPKTPLPFCHQAIYRACFTMMAALSLLTVACKKSHSGNQTPANNNYVSSVTSYSKQTSVVDSFTYDDSKRLLTYTQIQYDTSGGYPTKGMLQYVFNYQGTASTPSGYTAYSGGSPIGSHQLSYDGQNRIVVDSPVTGSGDVGYFSYPGNSIITRLMIYGSNNEDQLDTAVLNNGNITVQRIYYSNGSSPIANDPQGTLLFDYSSDVNPIYHTAISGAIGPLLNINSMNGYGGWSDFVSPNLINREGGTVSGLPAGTMVNFNSVKDNLGRIKLITIGLAGVTEATAVFNYY